MAFCQNCGAELADGAKFCAECGTPVGNTGSENVRKQEYVGNIRKCPSCGAEIPAFAGKCPSCGHEFSDTKVDNSVKEFFEQLAEYSSYEETETDGKNNWTGLIKYFMYLFAFFFLYEAFYDGFYNEDISFIGSIGLTALGLVFIAIALLLPPFMKHADKQKKNFIETFVVPNNKESILEFLMLSASQIQHNTNPITKEGKENRRWNSIWKVKIKQTIAKARITLTNDKDATEKIAMIKKEFGIK